MPQRGAPRGFGVAGPSSAPLVSAASRLREGTAAFERLQQARLARAQRAIERLRAVRGARTVANTLRPYDDAILELDATTSQASLMENVHPDAGVRAAAERMTRQASAFATALSLDRGVYDALAAVDLKGADDATRYYVQRTLRDFRLAGVDQDEPTRAKIQRLNRELVEISQEFERNIRGGGRTVTVRDTAELAGMPADYVERHRPAADGTITLTTDYPDAYPVFSYARNDDLRQRMYMAYNQRAFPENMAVLDRLIARRHELATTLGFPSWADEVTADKMVGSGRNAAEFIDGVVAASTARADREYRQLLERKRQDVPGATVVEAWENVYYQELVRRSSYAFDAQSVRPYFPYERVRQGVLDVTSRLFGVTFQPVKDAPVWHPSVECYELFENGERVGRFYLDMHPRPDKYKHAAQFDVRTGVAGRQIPEAALVCNFPGGDPGDPGLMEYDDVETFFHEFGHLLHNMFAGRQRWCGIGGIRTEQDFVEAPSQMLEEWTRDPAVLASFARHVETGEPIPAALTERMNRANDFGKGLMVRRQMVYARLSLSCYDRDPSQVDTDRLARELTARYQPFPFVEGSHFQAAFGHLDGYSAVYYTYMWSSVIAKDMFAQFDRRDLLAPGAAARYRRCVLEPGGSKPAAELVKCFLGRRFDNRAWTAWLESDE